MLNIDKNTLDVSKVCAFSISEMFRIFVQSLCFDKIKPYLSTSQFVVFIYYICIFILQNRPPLVKNNYLEILMLPQMKVPMKTVE